MHPRSSPPERIATACAESMGAIAWMHEYPRHRADRTQPVFERRYNAEIRRPQHGRKRSAFSVEPCGQRTVVERYQVDRQQIVEGKSATSHQEAETDPEPEARDPMRLQLGW
jgi:hypothetical protein